MTNDSWSIEIPGLTKARATEIRERLLPESPYGVILTDPAEYMVRGYDKPAVELLRDCLVAVIASGQLSDADSSDVQIILEDCESWLAQSASNTN